MLIRVKRVTEDEKGVPISELVARDGLMSTRRGKDDFKIA